MWKIIIIRLSMSEFVKILNYLWQIKTLTDLKISFSKKLHRKVICYNKIVILCEYKYLKYKFNGGYIIYLSRIYPLLTKI